MWCEFLYLDLDQPPISCRIFLTHLRQTTEWLTSFSYVDCGIIRIVEILHFQSWPHVKINVVSTFRHNWNEMKAGSIRQDSTDLIQEFGPVDNTKTWWHQRQGLKTPPGQLSTERQEDFVQMSFNISTRAAINRRTGKPCPDVIQLFNIFNMDEVMGVGLW